MGSTHLIEWSPEYVLPGVKMPTRELQPKLRMSGAPPSLSECVHGILRDIFVIQRKLITVVLA